MPSPVSSNNKSNSKVELAEMNRHLLFECIGASNEAVTHENVALHHYVKINMTPYSNVRCHHEYTVSHHINVTCRQ